MMQLRNIVWSRLLATISTIIVIVAFCGIPAKCNPQRPCFPNASSWEAAKYSNVWCRKPTFGDELSISYFGDDGTSNTQSPLVYVWTRNGVVWRNNTTDPKLIINITSLADYGVYRSTSNATNPLNTTYFVFPEECNGNCNHHIL